MTAIFRDKYGSFQVTNIEIMQWDDDEKKWVVFFDYDGKEEYYETQLETVMKD